MNTASTSGDVQSQNFFKHIVYTALIAGSLDASGAIISTYFSSGKPPVFIFQYIASSVLGPDAFAGATGVVVLGLVMHYLIAFAWTSFCFFLYPKLIFLKTNVALSGILYGVFVWTIMNLIAVPLTRIPSRTLSFKPAAIQMGILIFCIGIPIAYLTSRYFKKSISER